MKFVSVIIPCRNEAAFIGRCLDSILENDYPREAMEVIVADGMSTDGTRALIDEYAARDRRVRRIDNPERVTPCALNRAIHVSAGEVIARVDAHARIAPNYLSRCVFYLELTEADNVGGAMRTLPRAEGPFAGAIVAALAHRFGVGNSYFRIGRARAEWVDTVFGGCWRREVFERIGLFNERLTRSQDMEFSRRLKRAGGRTLLAPEIESEYFARSDLGSFWRHNFSNGEWAVLPFLYSDAIPVSLRHLVPMMFVMGLAAGAMAAAWTGIPLAAIGIPYLAASAASSVELAWRARRWDSLWKLPVVFASLHVGYGLGSVRGLFKLVAKWVRSPDPRSPAGCVSNRDTPEGAALRRRNPRGSGASAGAEFGSGRR
ncbi:MAG TPA: glycosyltransferase family 2 protein [Bryobacteraceae bacterium]|nr:glycosyltransferase family 2 protein [Bryobacteraceae bacterium]